MDTSPGPALNSPKNPNCTLKHEPSLFQRQNVQSLDENLLANPTDTFNIAKLGREGCEKTQSAASVAVAEHQPSSADAIPTATDRNNNKPVNCENIA